MSLLRGAWHALAVVGLLVVLITATPVVPWWARKLAGPWDDPRGDVLIVLGGNVQDDNIIGPSSYWRAVYAVRAWREGGWREIVITGGGAQPTPISVPMREFLVASGVPAEVIRIETKSTSTRENATLLKDLLAAAPGQKVLLTSDYQMFRASRVFRKAGFDVKPRPFPDAGKQSSGRMGRLPVFLTLVLESVKICYYFLRGWI